MTAAVRYAFAEVCVGVMARFKANAVPCLVQYGPERYQPGLVTENAVILAELEGGDTFGPPSTAGGNPRPVATRNCGGMAEIRGRSTAAGASVVQHRAVVVALVHQLVAAFVRAGNEAGMPVTLGRGGFVTDPDQASEYGARYALQFSVAEDVASATTWATAVDIGYTGSSKLVVGLSETEGCAPAYPLPEEPGD